MATATTYYRLVTEVQTPAVDGDWDGNWLDSYAENCDSLESAKTAALKRRKTSEDICFSITKMHFADHFNDGFGFWAEQDHWRSCAVSESEGWLEEWSHTICCH